MDGQYWKGNRTMSTNEWLLTSDFWQFLEPWHGRWYENKIFIASCTDNIYDLETERWLLGDMIIPPPPPPAHWFHSVRPSVCPSVRQENKNDDKATFLDLEEQIKDACIEVKTYDKRDAFKFEIINYPDLSGNIPTKPAYGVFTSQVIRYARICSKKVDLLERVKSLTKKLLRKHYTMNGLKSSLKKCLKKHRWITTKLGPRLHQNLTEE